MNTATLKTKNSKNERGSLALEQILFIGAIVVMSTGILAFYGSMNDYFANFSSDQGSSIFNSNSAESGN